MKFREFICKKCKPPCIIRVIETRPKPDKCPFNIQKPNWELRNEDEREEPLGREIIFDERPLSWRKLSEKTCINCCREFQKAMCIAASVYENYREAPEELLEDHPELADCMVTKYHTLREIVQEVTEAFKKWKETKKEEYIWDAIGALSCFNYWLVKFAFGFCEMNDEKVIWEERR